MLGNLNLTLAEAIVKKDGLHKGNCSYVQIMQRFLDILYRMIIFRHTGIPATIM